MIQTDKNYIIGIDEVGAGALAGPATVCAVRAPKEWFHEGLNDSKKLIPSKRQTLCHQLDKLKNEGVISYKIVSASHEVIDKIGLSQVLKNLYVESVSEFAISEALIIIDGILQIDERIKWAAKAMPKADTTIPMVMAASILAKVNRDAYMTDLGEKFPVYDWQKNKGYGVKKHLEAIARYGYCSFHRKSFDPIKSMILKETQ